MFRCDRACYQNTPTRVNFCHQLATVQGTNAPIMAPQALMAGVHASIQAMEGRMERALTKQAHTLAKAIKSLKTWMTPAT